MSDEEEKPPPKGLLSAIGDPLGSGLGKVLSPVGSGVSAVASPLTNAVGNVTKPALQPIAGSVSTPIANEKDKRALHDANNPKPGGEKIGGNAATGENPLGL